MILLIDNYDSFTYNVYQMLAEIGADIEVIRNDQITLPEIEARGYEAIVISPGPGRPEDAGISIEAVRYFAGKLPVFGICMGHQVIGEAFGGDVVLAKAPVHGKKSIIQHDGKGLYEGLSKDFEVGRYHSLVVRRETLPDCLEVSAELADGTIMGLRHKSLPIEGVQFHPESILTSEGHLLLKNFLKQLRA